MRVQGRPECPGHTTPCPECSPAAPVVQGADEVREALVDTLMELRWTVAAKFAPYMVGGAPNTLAAELSSESIPDELADEILALAEVARLLAERDQAQAKVARVRELLAFYDRHEYQTMNVDDVRRALDGSA